MPQSFADSMSQLGMDPTLARALQTSAGINGNLKPAITAITPLTGAFGTTGTAIVDVTGTFSQTILNDNFRRLEDKINAVIAALKA